MVGKYSLQFVKLLWQSESVWVKKEIKKIDRSLFNDLILSIDALHSPRLKSHSIYSLQCSIQPCISMYFVYFPIVSIGISVCVSLSIVINAVPVPILYVSKWVLKKSSSSAPFQLITAGNLFSSFENWIVTRVIRNAIDSHWLTVLFVVWSKQRRWKRESGAWLAKGYHFYQINAIATKLQMRNEHTRRERMRKNQIQSNWLCRPKTVQAFNISLMLSFSLLLTQPASQVSEFSFRFHLNDSW